MKDIVSIGAKIPSEEIDCVEINEKISLSDADIIIFMSEIGYNLYRYNDYSSEFRGKDYYSDDSSFKIKEDFQHWKSELSFALSQKKTVFVFLNKKREFYVNTGEKTTSGTGRNQKVTNLVDLYDNYRFMPVSLKIHSVEGKKIICQSSIFKNFYDSFQSELSYECYLESKDIKDFSFATKTKDRCLGTFLNVNGGNLVLFPMLNFESEIFWDDDDNPTKKGKEFGKRLISHLIEIDKILKSEAEKTPKPDWINNSCYELEEATKIQKSIQNNLQKIKKIEEDNDRLGKELVEQEILLDLLFESGKVLENAVIKALKILGYQAENYDDGELEIDQIIVSPENDRFIGECEGKDNKDIDVSKFRQLQDALNADFQREEVDEKAFGLLFGNPQRLTNPTERTLDFTKKCKSGAIREQIGLIKTIDLFIVTKYLSENEDNDFKILCRKAIKEQLGQIIAFPDIPLKNTGLINNT